MNTYKKTGSKYNERYKTYNLKCRTYSLRFREGKDDKYIEFLNSCPNKMDFIRQAIDAELKKH